MRVRTMRAAVLCAMAAAAAGPAAAAERAHEENAKPVTIVGPLDAAGAVKVGGGVAATQSGAWAVGQAGTWSVGQSGAWFVGLDGAASATLGHIDAATSGLRYDGDGNLRVSVAGGGAADPSPADRSPFGFSAHSTIAAGDTVNIDAGGLVKVAAYSFHTDHDIIVVFLRGGSVAFGLRVPAGQSAVTSFAHAIVADRMQIQCPGGDACTVLNAVAAYE